jgi:hypothetical protein
MISETEPLKRRAFIAIIALVTNLVLWILIPSAISFYIGTTLPDLPLANLRFIFTFGAIITGLQVLGAVTDGMAISVPIFSGAYVASAFYVWEAVEGGRLSFVAAGMPITVSLGTLVFLLILPLLFNAVRGPVEFLLERSETGLRARELP